MNIYVRTTIIQLDILMYPISSLGSCCISVRMESRNCAFDTTLHTQDERSYTTIISCKRVLTRASVAFDGCGGMSVDTVDCVNIRTETEIEGNRKRNTKREVHRQWQGEKEIKSSSF